MNDERLTLDGYPWDQVEKNREFITRLFAGPAPDRPGCIVHTSTPVANPAEPPSTFIQHRKEVWNATESIRVRPAGGDDFVPMIGTGAGTCAMATAFDCEETNVSGVYWVKPAIAAPSQIDTMKKPKITAGKLGMILEQTRAYAECADARIPIKIMDFQSPFTTVEQILGSDRFFTMPYDEPGRLRAIMDIVTDFAIEFFKAQMEAAGPGVCPGGWPPIWS